MLMDNSFRLVLYFLGDDKVVYWLFGIYSIRLVDVYCQKVGWKRTYLEM